MKFLAMLKDSLRETIDSKVFFVVIAISVLFIGIMATLSLTPNPADEAMTKLIDALPDGAQVGELPILGKIKVTEPRTQYKIQDLKGPEGTRRPWEGEYQFVIESRDLQMYGVRVAILEELIRTEQAAALNTDNPRRTRGMRIQEDIEREAHRIQDTEGKKGTSQVQMQEQLQGYITLRIMQELQSLKQEDMENFISEHLKTQGNWDVTEVKFIELPEKERSIKITARVPIKEGDDIRITSKEVDGEVNRFRVTVKSKGDTYGLWPHKATLLFGAIPLGDSKKPSELAYYVTYWGVWMFGAPVIMLLSCIITAFYIPNMLRKGTVDLLLSKPISRFVLMLYKYTGGLTFMFINTTLLIFGLWIVLGLRTSIWEPAFLITIPVLTFQFAFFYALSTLSAVFTRSPIVSILLCIFMWGFLWLLGWTHYTANVVKEATSRSSNEGGWLPTVTGWLAPACDVAHTVAPHYLDLDWLADYTLEERSRPLTTAERERKIKSHAKYNWGESILVTGLYIGLLLGGACWRFSAKDY